MATLLTVSVLIASGSAVSACAAYAIRRWRMSHSNTPRNRSRNQGFLARSLSIRATTRGNSRLSANNGTGSRLITAATPPRTRPAGPREECIICRDEPGVFPRDPPSRACRHKTEVCLNCLQKTIKEAVKAGHLGSNGTLVRCPTITCNQWMQESDILTWADPETCVKYQAMANLPSNRSQPNLRCLNSRCNGVQKQKGKLIGSTPVVTCLKCGQKQCYRHQMKWHEGFTCAQWDKKKLVVDKKNDQLSVEWIVTNTKACPGRRCGRRIQKSEGCDHITCSKLAGGCGHQFCWLCLAPWDEIRKYDNSKHYDHCKYYTGKPKGHPAPSSVLPRNKRWWQVWRKAR